MLRDYQTFFLHLAVMLTIKASVTVKNEYGEAIAEEDIPAKAEGVYEVTTPENNEGGTIEVSDDNGLVYSDFQ